MRELPAGCVIWVMGTFRLFLIRATCTPGDPLLSVQLALFRAATGTFLCLGFGDALRLALLARHVSEPLTFGVFVVVGEW